jgi:hypothetical protein
MEFKKMLDLQLFAEGGEGGGEGGAVVSPADDGQAALEALGVPKEKISQRAKEAVGRQRRVAKAQRSEADGQAAAAAQTEETPAEENAPGTAKAEEGTAQAAPQRMTWQEIMRDPEYNGEMQKLIRARLKDTETLRPALEMLAGKYGIDVSDPGKLDAAALGKAILEDDSLWEQKAGELGVEPDVARRIDQMNRFEAQRKAEQERSVQEEERRRYLVGLDAQAQELKKDFPDFDLLREMENPVFARMVGPKGGMKVADVYYAVHRAEIQKAQMQAAAQKAAEQVAASVQANRSRPVEHGVSGQAASQQRFDPSRLSREEQIAFNQMIKSGRKIVPGEKPW